MTGIRAGDQVRIVWGGHAVPLPTWVRPALMGKLAWVERLSYLQPPPGCPRKVLLRLVDPVNNPDAAGCKCRWIWIDETNIQFPDHYVTVICSLSAVVKELTERGLIHRINTIYRSVITDRIYFNEDQDKNWAFWYDDLLVIYPASRIDTIPEGYKSREEELLNGIL